ASDRGGDLRAEKFLTKIVRVLDGDTHDGQAVLLGGLDCGVLLFVRLGFEAEIGGNAIAAVRFRLGELFAIDGNDALALFSGRFGDELLEPGAEIMNSRGRN